MKSSDRIGAINDLTHSTVYALKFDIILHDNSSQIFGEQQCLKTKVALHNMRETFSLKRIAQGLFKSKEMRRNII